MDTSQEKVSREKLQSPEKIRQYVRKAEKGKEIQVEKDDRKAFGLVSIKPYDEKKVLTFRGFPASTGKAKGRAIIVKDKKSLKKIKKGKIAVLKDSTPQMVPYIVKADGFIGERGSVLCHLGIISREYGVPCMLAVKEATEIIKEGDLVKFNTENYKIEVIR